MRKVETVCSWVDGGWLWTTKIYAQKPNHRYACIGEFTARGVSSNVIAPMMEAALLVLPKVAEVA